MKNISLTGSNVLLEWKESDEGALQLPDELRAQINAQNNGVTKALAVGPDCKTIKEGDWVLLNGTGRLLVLDGITYGMVKEHQIDATFKAKPRLGKNELDSFSNIKIEKTIKKAKDFNTKHNL
ncbi:hypothetical protein CMI37_02520 [Candidatus Pacearchaeota archaeon]|nr:hypothetical protein [Candidatus Pacearchaeota archaeon]|tara:strand:- start:330 stop:698 length:369 start_codon:yes stop_codon:yes gene_type:complete